MSLDAMSGRTHHLSHHLPYEQRHHFAIADATLHQQQQQHYLLNVSSAGRGNPLMDENDISDYSVIDFSSPPSSSSSASRQRKKSSSISHSGAVGAAASAGVASTAAPPTTTTTTTTSQIPLNVSSSSAWSKSFKNTQSLDRSVRKSKGSRMFSRNSEYGKETGSRNALPYYSLTKA